MISCWSLLLVWALTTRASAHFGAPIVERLQVPFSAPTSQHRSERALTDVVKAYIEKKLADDGVRGMSIAVVHTDWLSEGYGSDDTRTTEYGNFGIRSEDGDPMTSDVCTV